MPGPDKFTFDLSKLRGIYDTMRNKGYRESWEEFKGGMVGKDKYQVRKRIFDALKSNNDTSAKSYEEFVDGLRFVAPAKPKVAAAPKLDLPKPSSGGGKPADGSEFFGKVMRGENVSGSEPIVPKRQDYGGFDKMMTADGRPLTGDATDTWERKLVRDHGKEAGLDDEQIRRIEDGLKVKNIVADMEQTKRDAAKIGRSEASSADLAADASYHDETSREADRRRRESGNYNTQVEFDRLKNNNPLIKTWKLSDHLSSVRNNDEEWLATGEKWYDENEGVFKSRVISNYGNEYVRSESVDEVIGRLKKESEELGRKVDERQLELYGGDKTKRTIADATATLTGQKLIFGMDPQLYHDDYGRSLAAAKRKIDERIETLEGHRDDPGFWAGVGERLSSRDWWTLGASDVADLSQDLVLKQKIENGEELSDADVAYLRSSMYADRDGQFYGKRGFLNRAGKLTADAIPFVAEFVFTGGGMNALQGATKLGMKAATQVGKNALKRAAAREAKELAADVTKDMTKGAAKKALGTRAKMWLLKNTGVVADDLARAGVMANTVGAGRTAGDAIGRYVGSVGVDDEGKFVYEGGVSAGEALLKAEVGNTLEYYTEMLGNHLKIGDWVAKGTEKIGAGKLSKAIKWAGSNKWLEKGGIQDLPSEGLEEEANIVLNSMLVGDNKLSDLWDGETQADIWGGMALSVGFMRSVAAAHEGYVWSRYKMQERKVERADVVAGYRFGDMADWSALKERIDGTTNEDMKGVVMSIMNDDGLHAEQKKAALDYVGSLMQLRGYNLGSVNDANDKEAAAKEAKENGDAGFVGAGEAETEKVEGDMEGGEAPAGPDAPTSNSETAALPSIDDGEQGGPVGAAFNRGREADAQERQDIAIELASGENVEAKEAWNGVVQRINEDADLMVAQQRAQTKEMQHKDGNVRPAILKEKDSEGNDQQVYIVDGNVEMMPDGSMVDKAASDNIVVVYNPATGERKQIAPTADDGISSLGEVTTADQREADIERSRQAYVQAQIDEAQGTVRVVPGQQLVLPTGEEGVVVAIDAEGEDITVALGDGRQATVQRSELQRFRDEKALADYRQRHGITEEPAAQQAEGYEPAQPQAEGRVAGAPTDYTTDMELTIRDEDGSEKPAMVMGRVRYENGSFVPDENGKIIEYYMGGEVKHAHEDVLSRDVVGYVAPHQTEAAPVEEASAETPATVETTPPPIEQQAEAVPQPMQTEEPMPAQPAIHNADESNLDITSRERVKDTDPMPVREDGEEDWQATTPERAHAYIFNEAGLSRSEGNEFIAAQIQAAQSALMKASSANMPKVGTSIRKYNEAKAKRQEKIDEAQRVLDYWNSVREIQNAIAREENERRAAEDAARHEEAVAQVQAEYEARKRAEAERKAVGNENPMPAITDKWNNATKVDGHSDEIMLPDGTALKGHYVLHESGASSPSHNPETWQKTEGFPMDVNGGSVNDRDYERDLDAQEHTQRIAREYDQRALQNVPVVSNDGVVLSGNGRTMAGELAARDNTDGAYVNYLKEYAPKFGFTAEQVVAMQHPRVSFVPDEAMPYTAETFAKFNQQEMKSQNKTEMAVKLGKTVSDDSFKGIVRTINGYDTLGDFYNDADASLGAVYDLHNAGVVPQAQLAEMVDGVRGQEKLSAVGREFLENMLIGKAFEGAPDVVRMLTAEPLMRQTVITALGEIVDNIALGGGWSLQGELADAVKLCFDARQGGAKYGEIVSTYARQGVLFADPDELQTVADFNNATMLMLADVLNDKRVTLLKTTLQLYNNNARESASGQADMFAGGVRSREDILRDVINFINENYGKRKEIEAARAAAVERRKADGVVAEDKPGGTRSITSKLGSTLVGTGIQQNGTPPAVGGGSEDTGRSERGTEETPTERELADNLRNRERQRQEKILPNLGNKYSLSAEQANNGELFYQDAEGNTNLAVIPDEIFERLGLSPVPFKLTETMGWHVYDHHAKEAKLSNIGDAIDFVLSIIKNVDHVRLGRNNSYIFSVENGRNKIGKRAVTIVVNSETGEFMGISTSGYETLSKLKERPLLWERGADFAPEDVATPTISTIKSQQGDETLSRTKGQSNASSDGKGKVNSSTAQAKGVKVAENQGATGVQGALTAYEKKEKPVSASSSDIETEPEGKRNGTATPQNGAISEGKESENPSTNQAKGEKVAENQSPSGVEVAVDAAERRVLEEEAKRTASHFPTETREEAAAFDRRVGEMSDLELLSFIKADGNGDVNKALHPSVYDEFDYRYGDEISAAYDWYLGSLLENGTTLEQAEDMLANIRRDKGRLATDRRAELLGQEDALQDYIVELKNREDQQSVLPKEEVLDGKVAEKKSPSAVEGGLSATKHKANTEPTESQKDAAAPEPTTEEGSRLAELRTKYPDRVFGERHENGSVTYYDEDAFLVSRLLGLKFDGEDLTLSKEEADKALEKLLANGHKAAYYGDEYKPKYDENGNRIDQGIDNIQPVGKGVRKGKKIADKNLVLTAYDETSADSESPVATNKSLAGSATSVSSGKGTDLFGNAQGSGKQSSSDGKIDDVGEVLAGARKDMRGEIAKSLANVTEAALIEKPFGKVYKKPDLKKAVESGALREKDAIFYEALFSMVNQQKPKVTQSEMRSKRYIPDYKTKAERWAADTFKQMEVLRQFMELDEPGRDAMMERMLADRYPTREQELAEIEKRKGWNPDYEGHKYAWGEMTTPNPLWVTHEVMNRLGYSVGDKLDVPYGVVKANMSGTGYSIENLKGERASLFGSGMTLDEAIDRIVYLAKLKRGDADVSHPTGLFSFPATKSESGESGRYRVMWGRDYKTREFDSKEDADAFAQTKSGAYVSPIMETKRRFGYKVRFIHPLTGEKLFVDDAEFDTKEEAQAYFDGNFEKLNEATNAKLQDEREMKGEKKMLTADDVVHVTMVHSGNGGWTHAVVIDKKYANNDGKVRIIKEGFASRKDAKAFADRVKGDVLKTVLKHKEDAKKIVYFDTGENSRIGEDYRNGKNVDAEDFMNTFGFRGVQFGNWTNQADRQMAVNQAYDAFMDMARLIGVSPKAMSLNGELGIAFGARGVGGSAAHYERGEVVINLTKTQGAGSLAHEWWHALDNYFARRAGSADDMVTDNRGIEMRDALRKAFNDMLDMVKGSDYAQRSTGKGEYWGRTHEITARLLAEWVDRELKKRGELNTFLSRGAVVERGQQYNYNVYEVLERLAGREPMSFEDYRELPESLKGIPYPSAKEVEQFSASLRHIFDTLEEKVDEETGNVMLYEPTATYETRDGKKVVWRSLFDDMDVRSSYEVAKVSQDTQQGQGQNQVIAPSEIRLRKLKKGETCHVERRYVENGMFDFTGKEKVESAEDVAYIFRQLENAAVENSFLVLVKDGRPTVIHLGVGSYANVMAPYEQALVAYRELKPEQVYFVHNHPSGVLKASRQDQEMLKRIKMAFGEDVVQQGIIIDTTSGKYGEFDMVVDNYDLVQTSGVEAMPQSEGAAVPIKVYQFSRQVFAPDWNPESAFKIVSSESVAEFVSSHRLGKHKKMSFLVVNNSGDVVANVFLPWTKLSDIKRSKDAGELLAGYVHQCGGVSGVLYGNYEYEPDDQVVLSSVSVRMRQLNAQLLDAVHVEHSAYENGWAGVGEPKEGYGVGATDVRSIAQRMDEERGTEVARFVDFLRRGKLGEGESRYFHVGDTGGLLNEYGISGKITVSSSAANSHHNKDKDHLSDTDWVDVFDKINEPIAITRYGDRPNSFRIYTIVEKNGKNICVGVDVNSVGRNVNITNIKTGFARDIANALNEELVYPGSRQELETAIQERSLRHNREVYPEQPYDAAKLAEKSEKQNAGMQKNEVDGMEDSALYRIREDEPPTKTGIGYKVFVLKDGKLYPPMVANPGGEATPVGVWLDADAAPVAGVTKTGRQQVKAGGKGTQGGSGKLSYRPGWHLGEIPYALQFNRLNPETGEKELFPANFVWAEVEYANDVDYQEEAMSYGMNASGKFQHSLAGLPRLPENGSYRYRTNPNPETDPWVITGAMKVNRILKPSEVDAMVEAAGREPQQRQAGAVTDEQVDALNATVKRTMQEDRDMMRSAVEQMGEKLHTDINIIEDVNEITHPNAAVQERRRKSKGWYDTATGQVNIVLDNNRDVDDVKASVGHETIAHKGLRELVGEENYDEFLDETYQHLRDDLKQGVDAAAGRAFVDDVTKNGKRAKSYEQHRRTAVDELFGRLAEKPFEEFTEGERTLWQKLKAAVRKLLDKFLGTLKLPKWFELGDNELRYILWRSKERLERGREHPIDLARDIVKREELGLTDEARYNMGDAPETFKARQRRAVENKGTVMPGLNDAQVKVVDVPRHSFTGTGRQAIDKAKIWANGHLVGTHTAHQIGNVFDYNIDKDAIDKFLSSSSTLNSENLGVHLAVLSQLPNVINNSVEVEEHPDYKKVNGKRKTENGVGDSNLLVHRMYGAVQIDGNTYRVKTTMHEHYVKGNAPHDYRVTKIELLISGSPTSNALSNSIGEVLDGQTTKPLSVSSRKSNTTNGSKRANGYVHVAKLLQDVGKSYDLGKKLLEESKIADESTDLYRDSDDVWTDGSMGLQERMTAAATRLANNHREDKTLRNDAMRAIGGNLADLRKAMSLQRTFDRTTVKRVADLARVLITNGYINNATSGEIKRLLSAVKNSVGHNDIEGDVQKVMDIMVDNQLKHAEETLHELEAIKGSKVDARGVEVQGQLDAEGQTLIKSMKEAQKIVNPCGGKTHDENGEPTAWGNALESAIMRMSSNDQAVADAAAIEYAGMQMAQQWFDTIQQSKLEEQELRQELKSGYVDDSGNPIDDPQGKREWRASIEEAIRQNKIERVQDYYELVGRLTDSLRESLANAKDFKEAEKQRIREIQHNANSDMEGRPDEEHQMPANTRKKINNWMGNSLFAPLATYMEMLRLFGRKSANGEGYLFNRFGRGWIDARQQEIRGVRDKYAILDAKAAELFGGQVKTWGDLIRRVGKLPKGTVSFWNGGEMKECEMTQGNLMYIYMVNKMLDGRMKLRKMGISEEDVAEIERVLDPRLIELADWLQDEFLVQTRNEYNETHKRMFGASMAAIEHYFPLRVLKNAIDVKAEDLDKPEVTDGISTITGGIIKRRRNSKPLDILNADALHVILSHVAEMEHWNAYAEFNRDLNTLRSYRHFRNQVQNMNTIYGNGKNLWEKFNDVCQMATGAYKPKGDGIEKAILSAAQGVTAAKVAFRIFTALKQFASLPAYFPYVRADYLVKSMARPDVSWSWCMEHLPIFEERWKSRVSGDPRLAKSILTAADWRQNLAVKVARAGMAPNAFVDALTVSMGAYAVYQTRKGQYLRDGYSEEQAERRAIQDTEMVYNETQQSGESAFTSTMQTDRTWWKVMFSVFRNSSMAYQRQLHGALRDLGNMIKEGGVSERLAFMKKQMIRDGLSEEQADAASKRRLRRQFVKDGLAVATFGYIMQLAWNMTGYLPYLLFGDDDETKDEFWDDIWAHTMGGWLEGLTGGDVMSLGIGMWLNGEVSEWKLKKEMPLTTDLFKTGRELFKGEYSAFVTDAVNLCVQMGLGMNPQSITDGVLAIMDACGDDPALAHEATICISRILQVPQSQIDKMYFDEIGLSGDEVSKYTPAQLAERYAEFKVKRGRFFAPWSWDDEDQIGKFTEKANKTINERTEQMGDKNVNEAYLQYEEVYNGVDAKVNEAKKKAKTDYVEAAQLMAEARSDSKAFETYQMFKPMDGYFNEIVKLYLGAKTPDEAALCRQAVLDYKSAMVKVLEAPDVSTRDEAIDSLRAVMQDFADAQSRLRSAE